MAGSAERALSSRQRHIVEDLQNIVGWSRPPYATSSGFRFVYDRSAGRDVADVSAVAQELAVLVRSVSEQDLNPPGGSEPGTVQPADEDDPSPSIEALIGTGTEPDAAPVASSTIVQQTTPSSSLATSSASTASASSPTAAAKPKTDTATTAPPTNPSSTEVVADEVDDVPRPSVEALLSVPATVAGRERAEQACRAMAKGWYEEAEELFLAGTEATPTDPLSWFGAGLAASRMDAGRAAGHLTRASRYLTIDDPPGAAYAAILAASLHESAGDLRSARQLLRTRLDDFDDLCPAISMHLGRLGPDRQTRLAEAISIDPMLDADLQALGLEPSGDVIKDRLRRTEQEIAQLDYSIAELRRVAAGASDIGPPEEPSPGESFEGEDLSLVRAEVQLWQRLRQCENEIDLSRRITEDHERTRRESEVRLERVAAVAGGDLDGRTAVPYFLASVLIAAAVLVTFFAGRSLAGAYPGAATVIMVLSWLVQIGLIGVAVMTFVKAWWPHRGYERARAAKVELPSLEWEVSQEREAEFLVRRRYSRASQAAELRIRRIIDRRHALVPRRPAFVASDLPLVSARA